MDTLVFIGQNPRLQSRLEALGQKAGLDVMRLPTPDMLASDVPPKIIVIELEVTGAIDAILEWKKQWPACMVAGSIRIPVQERWHAAVAAGCDFVSNWGALPRQLQKKIEANKVGKPLVRKATLLKVMLNGREGDGMIGRLPDAPDGAIAIYRLGERLCAFRDVCPHAGFSLVDGERKGTVITCPEHGSQFDICTGERLRGPADFPIRIYPVITKGDQVFVEIGQAL